MGTIAEVCRQPGNDADLSFELPDAFFENECAAAPKRAQPRGVDTRSEVFRAFLCRDAPSEECQRCREG